ncbi:hypothetical protein [Cryptosporangium arvum]|uniref:hypothetical protein n=1 Tax=Cryptosporangium arvum TaxID=80871 RepID=UPI0004AD7208|nr:hypothetical protein [Cryptosporangium arvum]
MSIDDSDTRMTAEFAAYRYRAVPTYPTGDGAAVRAIVTRRRRRRRAAIACGLVLLVALGAGLFRGGEPEHRLVPAVAPSSSSASPPPTPTKTPAGPLDDVTIDFSALPEDSCGGPTVSFKEASAFVDRLDTVFSYWIGDAPRPVRGDVTGDDRPDYVAELGCVGEGGGTSRAWLVVLTGDLPDLTVAGPGLQTSEPSDTKDLTGLALDGRTIRLEFDDGATKVNVRWDGEQIAPGPAR